MTSLSSAFLLLCFSSMQKSRRVRLALYQKLPVEIAYFSSPLRIESDELFENLLPESGT
jgi:hypothetical protein